MNNRDLIIKTTVNLIESDTCGIKNLTMRKIAEECNISLGLINYHFSSKEELIKEAVEKSVNGVIEKFSQIGEKTKDMSPFDKLDFLGCLTLDFLFEHFELSKISVMTDVENPKLWDNTSRTFKAYVPLVKLVKPELSQSEVKLLSLRLVLFMQQVFIRHELISSELHIDLKDMSQRHAFHRKVLKDILGE